jgi:TnpA family transposase
VHRSRQRPPVAAQTGIDIVACWGGGLVASADGLRFVVPVRSVHSGPNPRYFGLRHGGATWLNVVNDQVMGIGGIPVPGTLPDSLVILDAIHNIDVGPRPEVVITDTGSYSDIVFALFAICGYQFSPRIADLADTRLWRTDRNARYRPLNPLARHKIRLARVAEHWGDMLRFAGSLPNRRSPRPRSDTHALPRRAPNRVRSSLRPITGGSSRPSTCSRSSRTRPTGG